MDVQHVTERSFDSEIITGHVYNPMGWGEPLQNWPGVVGSPTFDVSWRIFNYLDLMMSFYIIYAYTILA